MMNPNEFLTFSRAHPSQLKRFPNLPLLLTLREEQADIEVNYLWCYYLTLVAMGVRTKPLQRYATAVLVARTLVEIQRSMGIHGHNRSSRPGNQRALSQHQPRFCHGGGN